MHGYNFFYIIILSIFVTYQALGAVKYSTFDNRTSYHCSPMPEVECKGLMNSHSEGQNQVFTLKRGVDAFTYRVKLIREAKRSIRMQYLIYKNDEAGRFIANLLKQKHDEGVQVTLLVDMLASFGFGVWDFFRDLMRYGIEIASYEEPVTFIINEIFGTNPGSLLHRYHEKIMVVDGEDAEKGVAIMGGLNIANEYFRISKEAIHLWTDMDIGFKGTAVKDAMEMFDRDVNYFRRLTRTGHSQPSGEDIFDDASLITRANKRPASSIEHGTLIDETPKTDLEKMTVEYANLPLSALNLAVYTDAKIRLFQGRPRLKENYIEEVYVNMINESEREIIIVNAYYIPSNNIKEALRNAAKRGVKIHILPNSYGSTDMGGTITSVSQYYYHSLMSVNFDPMAIWSGGQVRIYEWKGRPIGEGTVHAKWASFDRKQSIIGSYNLAPRSKYFDGESIVAVQSRSMGLELAKFFHEEMLAFDKTKGKFTKSNEISPRQAERFFNNILSEQIKLWFQRLVEIHL